MKAPQSAVEAGRLLADALAEARLPHALGGALALGVAGVPRGTLDVDINVFIELARVPELVASLTALGVELDHDEALARAARDGMFVGRWGELRVDVFIPSIPFSWEAGRTRVQVELDGWRGWFLSAEAIAVFKLLFFRVKDIADLERLIAVRGDDLDRAYIRRWTVEMMGDEDERVRRWDELVARDQKR